MIVKLSNCNCIKKAEIKIVENQLNIKFGPNGTGKSTIGKAIYHQVLNNVDELMKLKPYNSTENENPTISIEGVSSVKFFDENYINSYLFSDSNSVLKNSFQVFIKNEKSDNLLNEINTNFENLNQVFLRNENLGRIENFLQRVLSILKLDNNKLVKRGGVNELIKGYGSGFNKYSELEKYKPFYEDRKFELISDWAKWRNDGIKMMLCDKALCPFCSDKLDSEKIDNENKIIGQLFKKSALETANEIKEILEFAVSEHYISEESKNKVIQNMGESSKKEELNAQLEKFSVESEYLLKKLIAINEFRPFRVSKDDIKQLEEYLNELIISKEIVKEFYNTRFLSTFIDEINEKIRELREITSELKKLFGSYDSQINKIIEEKQEDINSFFETAGFPYKFLIQVDEEQKAHSLLVPIKSDKPVNDINAHLSWGERNAFALVMFMFEAISANPDLVILDDPITSFDKNKKFAIMKRLFDGKLPSLKNKTVLLVTHDLQPVIDFVHSKMFSRYGIDQKTNAFYLSNIDNELTEIEILSDDLKNTVELTKSIATDENEQLPVRIVNLRKYFELTDKSCYDSNAYDLLSSLIHGRAIPTKKTCRDNENVDLSEEEILKGSEKISRYIKNFQYCDAISEFSIDKLPELINSSKDEYVKIICLRVFLEQLSESGTNLYRDFKREMTVSCKFLNESNHIENDYIFQLDPHKFHLLPMKVKNEINQFFSKKDVMRQVNMTIEI